MRGILFFAAGCMILMSGITCKQDKAPVEEPLVPVAPKNVPLLMEFTATHNPSSGSWGWDMMQELRTYSKGKALFMGVYPSGSVSEGFVCETANQLSSYYLIPSFPAFAVNERPKIARQGSVDVAKEKLMCRQAIDSFLLTPVTANVGLLHVISGERIVVESTIYFFSDAGGDYRVAYYIVEDSAMYVQAGHAVSNGSTPIPHPFVLRSALNGTWGERVAFGAIKHGHFINKIIAGKVDSTWVVKNLRVLAVLWKVDPLSGKYLLVNSSCSKLGG